MRKIVVKVVHWNEAFQPLMSAPRALWGHGGDASMTMTAFAGS